LLFVLLIGGLSVYLAYYRKPSLLEHPNKTFYPLNKILENGYFFDVFYEKVVARGVLLTSKSFKRVETAFFGRIPQLVANGVMSLAHNTQKYLDVFADELLYLATNKTLASASKIRKLRSGSIEHYIAAAIIGFLIILILIIVTMLR
jgi:NADH:ubiquinone oxidoreductase subunit 5 (subunit L)/multisubunit Na+/H+ antiporter MnhA subunit